MVGHNKEQHFSMRQLYLVTTDLWKEVGQIPKHGHFIIYLFLMVCHFITISSSFVVLLFLHGLLFYYYFFMICHFIITVISSWFIVLLLLLLFPHGECTGQNFVCKFKVVIFSISPLLFVMSLTSRGNRKPE